MYDFHLLRSNPNHFIDGLTRRGIKCAADEIEVILVIDRDLQAIRTELQALQARRHVLAEEIRGLREHEAISVDEAEALRLKHREASELKTAIGILTRKEEEAYGMRERLVATLPNIPSPAAPDGVDADSNVEIHRFGTPRAFVKALSHPEVAGPLMDTAKAGWMTGARFTVLTGPLAALERALGQFMIDLHTHRHGYIEMSVPFIVNSKALFGTGQLPKFEDDVFFVGEGRYLIPTAEVPLTNLVREQTTEREALPLRFTALTPCFRKEAGAAGRDTTGLIRQHQFMKCELVTLCEPDQVEAEFNRTLHSAEQVLKRLGLPYRAVELCAGDLGFSARRTVDLEVWMPSQGKYVEIASISDCGDFQTQRMKGRYRQADGKIGYLHSINGSGLAVGRTLAAVLENYQTETGEMTVPAILQPYLVSRL